MSKPLISASVAAPGFYGLNSQQSSVTLEDGFALEATNCIIDKYGRLGARKGWTQRNTIVDLSSIVSSVTLNPEGINDATNTNRMRIVTSVPHGIVQTSRTSLYDGNGDLVSNQAVGETPVAYAFQLAATYVLGYNGTDIIGIDQEDGIIVVDETTLEFHSQFSASSTLAYTYNNVFKIVGLPYIPELGTVDYIQDRTLSSAHRFVDITGSETIISVHDNLFYTGLIGELEAINPSTSNTLDDNHWQAATLNDKAYFFQEGYYPMVYDGATGNITDIEDSYANYIDPATQSAFAAETDYRPHIPKGNVVLSAYGRLWAARTDTDKMTVYWSDLLDGENWVSGSAGYLDLTAVMVQGTDEIIGLGAQNGRLIIFTRRSIVIYGDSTGGSTLDPATLVLVEVINRVGCVARDSIQNTGTDIIFLSEDGLRSLGRVIQEKSLPMRDLSANVRDELVYAVSTETKEDIKSVYSEDNAFYLLMLPRYDRIYCFDTRAPLPNGALRVTIWNNQTHINMLSLPNDVYFTNSNGLCEYFGYQDNGQSYPMLYLTNYFDLGAPTQTKILKKLTVTVIGLSSQDFVLKTAFDYIDSYRSYVGKLQALPGSEYNEAEYGLNDTVLSVSQTSSTITVGTGEHYIADFQLEQDDTYDVPLNLWSDGTYYYSNDDGSRTQTTVYTQQGSYTYEYSVGTVSEPIRLSVGGAGSVLQVGFETTVDGSEFSIQKMDVYAKQGRVY